MVEKIGHCRYCGQYQTVRVPEKVTDSEVNKEATKICTCEEARTFQRIEQSIDVAETMIKTEYAGDEYVQKLLMRAARPIGEHEIDKITISHGKCRYVMSRKTDGSIKMEKTTTTKEVKEA